MKNKLTFIFVLALGFAVIGQQSATAQTKPADTAAANKVLRANQDTTWTINVLKSPSSPGAELIGISPSVIQRPTDPSGFSASLLNATNNLSTIPNNYAVDLAPAWLFFGQHISYTDFSSNTVGKNIWQSLDISIAYKNVKDSLSNQTNTTIGIGVKVSLLRGNINSKATAKVKQSLDLVSDLVKKRRDALQTYLTSNPRFLAMNKQAGTTTDTALKNKLAAQIRKTVDSLNKSVYAADPKTKANLDSIKKIGESLDFSRYGWKLDLASGMSYYFPNQVYSSGSLNNAGAWLTGGFEDEASKVSFLGIARYLYNPKQAYADPKSILKQNNLSTFDTGFRLLFESADSKFTFGGELVYRSITNTTAVPSSYHYSISADYQVGKNQLLTFNIGRDFDGTVTKGGNLIAAFNFIIGFGNTKSIIN